MFFERNTVYLALYLILIALPLYAAGHNNDDWFNLPLESAGWMGHGRYAVTFWYEYVLSEGRALSAQLLFLYLSLVLIVESTTFLLRKLDVLYDKQVFLFSIISFISLISSFGLNELISFKGMVSAATVSFAFLYFFVIKSIVKPSLINLFVVLVSGLFVLGTYQTFFFAAFIPVILTAFVLGASNLYEKEMYEQVLNNIKPASLVKVAVAFGVSLIIYIVILEIIKNYYTFTERGGIDNFITIVRNFLWSPARLFTENIRSISIDTLLIGRISSFLIFISFIASAIAAMIKVKKINFILMVIILLYFVSMSIFSLDAILLSGMGVRSHPFTMFATVLIVFILIRFSNEIATLKNKTVILLSSSLLFSSLIVSAAWENTRILNMGDISKATALGGASIAIGSMKNISGDVEIYGNKDFRNNKTTFGNSAFHGVNTRRGIFKVLLDFDIKLNPKERPVCGEYPAINSINTTNKLNPIICLEGTSKHEYLAMNACKYKNITDRVSLCEFIGGKNTLGLVVRFNKCRDIVRKHLILVEEYESGRVIGQLFRAKTHQKMMIKDKNGSCSTVIKVIPQNMNNKITIREFEPRVDIKWVYTVLKRP